MPPVGCCTFLTFDSTTTVPGAITAPASSLVAAQPPMPPTSSDQCREADEVEPADRPARIVASAVMASLPTASATTRSDGRQPPAGRACEHAPQHLVARAERLLRAAGEAQHLVAVRPAPPAGAPRA